MISHQWFYRWVFCISNQSNAFWLHHFCTFIECFQETSMKFEMNRFGENRMVAHLFVNFPSNACEPMTNKMRSVSVYRPFIEYVIRCETHSSQRLLSQFCFVFILSFSSSVQNLSRYHRNTKNDSVERRRKKRIKIFVKREREERNHGE